MSKSEKKEAYKAKHISYRKQWEASTDVSQGMFCKLCQQKGNPFRGAWTTRTGIMQQSFLSFIVRVLGIEMQLCIPEWLSKGGSSVLEMHCSAVARQLDERNCFDQFISS